MSMILNDHITRLKKGYPTVFDKYDVSGGILGGENAVEVGTVLALTDVSGVFVPLAADTPVEKIAGIALAPNVKLTDTWSGDRRTKVYPGEAVNLCFNGLFAVEVAPEVAAAVKPGDKVGVADGALVIHNASADPATDEELPGWFFTGLTEGALVEIDVRR